MGMARTKTDRNTDIAKAIAPVLSHDEIRLLAAAARAFADMIDAAEAVNPTEDGDGNAATLRNLAEAVRLAIVAKSALGC